MIGSLLSSFPAPPPPFVAGLLIEMWKVTKVVEIKFDGMIAGIIPCIKIIDRPSYKSSTREYDIVSRRSGSTFY